MAFVSFPIPTVTVSFATSSTDNAVVRFDGTTGGTQNSGVTISDGGTVSIAPTASSLIQGVNIVQSGHGSYTDQGESFYFNNLLIPSDDAAVTGINSFQAIALNVVYQFGGSAMQGNRLAFQATSYLNGASSASNANRNYVGVTGVGHALTDDGGTGLNVTDAKGAMFGLTGAGGAANGATNLLNVTAGEFNTACQTGSSVLLKSIIQLSGRNDDAVAGASVNAMLWLFNQASAVSWDDAILIDTPAGGQFPIATTGSVLRTNGGTITNGVDLSSSTISGFAFASPGFYVLGTGDVVATGNYQAGATHQFYWNTRSILTSPSDGSINLTKNDTSTGVGYQIGGTQVVGVRDTGWTAMTGSPDKATAYNTGTVTLAELAGRVAELQAVLTAHGLIGA